MDDTTDAAGAMTAGAVSVERLVTGEGAQTNVSAKFMRLGSPVDADVAARVVGAKIDVPAVGACRRVTDAARVSNGLGSIELIDVGDVTLHTGSARMPLAVRAFPDVGDLVSGMFYTSLDAASDLPAGATYTLEGTGAGSVDRFTVEAEAPPPLDDVRVSGAPLLDSVTVEPGAPVTIQWSTASTPGGTRSGDLVLVDASADSGASVRCTFADRGFGVLPASALGSASAGAMTLTVHRVRERSFMATGIDAGEIRFDLSVMGRVSVAPPRSVSVASAPPETAKPSAP
jgi:hypothetical protein